MSLPGVTERCCAVERLAAAEEVAHFAIRLKAAAGDDGLEDMHHSVGRLRCPSKATLATYMAVASLSARARAAAPEICGPRASRLMDPHSHMHADDPLRCAG